MASHIPLIGEKAPEFECETTHGHLSFPKAYEGKWLIFFSHPADFTPVCTTEFMAFAQMHKEFREVNCELLGLSIDSMFSHIAWVRTIKEKINYGGAKNVEITFPVIADLSMDVAKKYGMLQPSASTTQAVRAVFIIDPKATIRAVIYYPLSNGRNMQELMRILVAMQTTDQHKVATPANWVPGKDVIIPPPATVQMSDERVAMAAEKGYKCDDWFLCTKPDPSK